jgi:hypothetical protein
MREEKEHPYEWVPRRSFFDLCTSHITQKDSELLQEIGDSDTAANAFAEFMEHNLPFYVFSIDQGHVVRVASEGPSHHQCRKLIEYGFSLMFVDIIRVVDLVRDWEEALVGLWFDADAPEAPDFPTIDWDTGEVTDAEK